MKNPHGSNPFAGSTFRQQNSGSIWNCVSVLHVCAPNDSDGNPCRCYVALGENNRFLGAWAEGYAAHHAVPSSIRHLAVSAFHIEAPAKQVEAYIEWHNKLDAPLC